MAMETLLGHVMKLFYDDVLWMRKCTVSHFVYVQNTCICIVTFTVVRVGRFLSSCGETCFTLVKTVPAKTGFENAFIHLACIFKTHMHEHARTHTCIHANTKKRMYYVTRNNNKYWLTFYQK